MRNKTTLSLVSLAVALALGGCGQSETAGSDVQRDAVAKAAAPEGSSWSQTITETADGGFVMGNPEAPVTLVEYGALTCVHCKDFALESSEELHRDFVDTGQVAYEFRTYLLHPIDGLAGAAMKCAGKDRYYPLMENIYANWDAFLAPLRGELEAPDIANMPDNQKFIALAKTFGMYEFFGSRGLGKDQLDQCFGNAANVIAIQDKANKGGEQFDISSTPTFILNGTRIDVPAGTGNWEYVRTRLRDAGAR